MKRWLAVLIVCALTVVGCGSAAPVEEVSPTTAAEQRTLRIAAVSWKSEDGSGGKCATGLAVADFLRDQAPVRVYDDATGDVLAETLLIAGDDDSTIRTCGYSSDDLLVPEVATYRFVFDGRHSVTKSKADLQIAATEMADRLGFEFADLYFTEEIGA